MSVNQIGDEGAVIGYQPNLHYDKNRTAQGEVKEESSDSSNSQQVEYHSQCVLGFMNNTPSKTLANLDFAIVNMKKLIDKLSKAFQDGNWNEYGDISTLLSAIDNGNTDYITKFVDYHRDNITGDITPELIEAIYNTEQRLELVSSIIKQLYYGNENITQEECAEVDSSYIHKILAYENTGELGKVNYAAISSDAGLNRSISQYAFNANKGCIMLANVITKHDAEVTNPSKVSLVEKLFSEVTDEIGYRNSSYGLQQSVEILEKTLYNYYNKRQDLLNLYHLLGDTGSTYLTRKIKTYQSNLDDALRNVNRAFIGNQMHLSELEKLESEKYYLLNIYAGMNNNS